MKKTLYLFLSSLVLILASSPLWAQATDAEMKTYEANKAFYEASASSQSNAIYAICAVVAIAVAAAFGTLSQAKAASTALDGIARNPGAAAKVQTPMIIGLALIESLVIYGFVIAILLLGKIVSVPSFPG